MTLNSKSLFRKFKNHLFTLVLFSCSLLVLTPLILILKFVITEGASSLSLDFFTELPKPVGEIGGGMKHAILGTIYMVLLGGIISIPLGIGCGVYLAEFRKSKLSRFLRICVDLMTGIPSIVIGIFAYLIIVVPLKSFSAL
ncbi:MAG: ABC transporter permease subunit, partial [Bacteriovoracaceae bacterium]|nr:ABC transporter permease subunit [Bacteriovoracaceae bacterium]